MNFVYDIFLNFNESFYDFYEWNKNDYLIHIKKIPIFKVNSNVITDILNSEIKLDSSFFDSIRDRCDIFSQSKKTSMFLLTDEKTVIGIEVDNKGNVFKKSSLNLGEELDILDFAYKLPKHSIKYTLGNKIKYYNITRRELYMKSFILKRLNKLGMDKIKYLFFECFNFYEEDDLKAIKRILKEIQNNNQEVSMISYNFLKLVSTN